MSLATTEHITATELERLILDREPGAVFVPRTILRRVVRNDSHLSGLGLRVPHSVCYTISRDSLLRIVDRDELRPAGFADLPERVILIRRPEPDKLNRQPRPLALLFHWRVLFHAHVHLALESRAAEGKLTVEDARQRWRQIGDPARREIATLLHEERSATAEDPLTLWVEFAAFYLGLREFMPDRIPDYFPGVRDFAAADDLLAADVDAEGLLAATRLPGAADPGTEPGPPEQAGDGPGVVLYGPPQAGAKNAPAPEERQRFRSVAGQAAGRGNDVRAAIWRARAGEDDGARADLDRLLGRLEAALPDSAGEITSCRDTLADLLGSAAHGFWPQEARLLYDLQKICVDRERTLYKVDLAGWLFSLGRRPVKRLVPGQREVLVVQRLRSALRRVPRVRLPEAGRQQLAGLLRGALRRAEGQLRETFLPRLTEALDGVGFRPANLPERAARHKIVEELLHRIDANGLLTVSDVRDTLSRNDLKLNDLGGPVEFLCGDRLLQLDRRLAGSMESVYRRGEFYLRGLQRFSSLAFGTRLGRLLTTWLALPFGGAYVALEFLQYVLHHVSDFTTHFQAHLLRPMWQVRPGIWISLPVLALGIFLVGVFNFPGFRRWVGAALRGLGQALHWLFIAGPRALLNQPLVRRIVQSPPVLFARRFLIKPAVCAGLVWLAGWLNESGREWRLGWSAAVFCVALLFFNSRVGRAVQESVAETLLDAWHHLGELFPALFRFIMWLFKVVLQAVDRLFYSVDEWLRFRAGENRAVLVVKAVLGFFWNGVAYVVRFALNLLIEPQINPIKHFPVVTVSHKVMFPFIPTLAGMLITYLALDKPLALAVAGVITTCTPGIFGFLVWELKENYRLYAANRPPELRPVLVGSHGETVLRFLRPGFHSGTVPKAFARLRRAAHRADPRKRAARADKQRVTLHHVEEELRHFVECDLLFFLEKSGRWGSATPRIGDVVLGLHSIQVEVKRAGIGGLWIEIEECGGRLTATIRDEGLLGTLDDDRRRVLRNALIGFYKKLGVTLSRAQVAKCLELHGLDFRVTEIGLAVMSPASGEEVVYALDGEERIVAQGDARLVKSLPTFTPRQLLFQADPLSWEEWVDVWECEQAGYAKELMRGLPLWDSP